MSPNGRMGRGICAGPGEALPVSTLERGSERFLFRRRRPGSLPRREELKAISAPVFEPSIFSHLSREKRKSERLFSLGPAPDYSEHVCHLYPDIIPLGREGQSGVVCERVFGSGIFDLITVDVDYSTVLLCAVLCPKDPFIEEEILVVAEYLPRNRDNL